MKCTTFLGLIVSILIVSVCLMPKKEFFEDNLQTVINYYNQQQSTEVNSVDAYKQYYTTSSSARDKETAETNYMKKVYKNSFTVNYNDELLILDRCIQIAAKTIDSTIMNTLNFPVQKYQFMINTYSEIETRIMIGLQQFFIDKKLKQLNGPVYALISQAPYLRILDQDCSERTLSAQFNYSNYSNQGYIVATNNTGLIPPNYQETCSEELAKLNTNKIFITLYLLYPTYNKNGKLIFVNWENIKCNMAPLFSRRSHNDKCFIQCKGESNKICGCLNTTTPYKAICLGDTSTGMNNIPIDYATLYRINGVEASRRVNGLFNNSFFGDSVKVKAFDYNIDANYCDRITKLPEPIFNRIS